MYQRFILCFLVFLAACSPTPASPTVTLPPPIVTIIRPTEIPITETSTALPSPTALPHFMYPYTIAGLRERTFTGGEIGWYPFNAKKILPPFVEVIKKWKAPSL